MTNRLLSFVALLYFLPASLFAASAFEECREAILASGRRAEILIAGERHGTAQAHQVRRSFQGFVEQGRIILGLEGQIHGVVGQGQTAEGYITSFEGRGGGVQGIESPESIITVGTVASSGQTLPELYRIMQRGAAEGRAEALLQVYQRIHLEQRGFIQKITTQEFARKAWMDIDRGSPSLSSRARTLIGEIDGHLNLGIKPQPLQGAFKDPIAYEQVLRLYADSLINEAEARAEAQGRTIDFSVARDFLNDPTNNEKYVNFHRYIANHWRNEDQALNVAKLTTDAVRQGKAVAVVVGAAHVDPIVKILQENLKEYAEIKGINAENPF